MSHKSYTQKMVEGKNGPSIWCTGMISSTRNHENGTKYAVYDVPQNSPGTRFKMENTRRKVQDFYQVLI